MARPFERGIDRRVLDNLAGIHGEHARAGLGDDSEIVGDEEQRRAGVAGELEQEVDDLGLDGDIERRRRLVGDQQPRLAHQRDGDHGALAHAAGKLVRVLVDAAARQRNADLGEGLDGALARLLLADAAMGTKRLADLVADGEYRVERAHRLLEDHADLPAAHATHVACRQLEEIATFEADLARHPARSPRQQAED